MEYSSWYISEVSTSTRRRYAKRLPREERREQLLDATLALVTRKGWTALRVDAVAAEAHIAKSVIYAVFGSLEGLQHATLEREQERVFAVAEAAVAAARDAADPASAMAGALGAFLDGVSRQPDSWRLVLLPPDGTPPSVAAAIRDGRERWRSELELVVPRFAPPGIDAELVAHVARGNAEYLARLMLEDPEQFPLERLMAFALSLFAEMSP